VGEKCLFGAALLLTVSSGVVLAGQLEDGAKTLLEAMPCRAWTIMHDNNFSGQDRNKIQVENWTIRYQRDYLRRSVERMKKDEPEKDWQNVDGADVDDRQIVSWITAYCMKNPDDPFIKAAFLLFAALTIIPDHRQIPIPP
jgi:hypothetical protein